MNQLSDPGKCFKFVVLTYVKPVHMPLQYLQNDAGQTTAVLIPIEEWQAITQKHADLAALHRPAGIDKIDKIKPSDFKGILSPETAEALQKHVQQSRDEWDRTI